MSATSSKPQILILGGGIIGLSTAIALQDHPASPYDVTIIAKDLPSRNPSSYLATSSSAATGSYASAWAGAHHVSDAKSSLQLELDKTTYEAFAQLKDKLGFGGVSESKAKEIVEVHQIEYFECMNDQNEHSLCWYPEYRRLIPSALPPGVRFGCTFRTFDINVPRYLPRLLDLFVSLGGRIISAEVRSISEAIEIFSNQDKAEIKPEAMVVSPGLGAIDLLDDTSVHPVRGQTVLIRAPWCTTASQKDILRIDLTDNAGPSSLPE